MPEETPTQQPTIEDGKVNILPVVVFVMSEEAYLKVKAETEGLFSAVADAWIDEHGGQN